MSIVTVMPFSQWISLSMFILHSQALLLKGASNILYGWLAQSMKQQFAKSTVLYVVKQSTHPTLNVVQIVKSIQNIGCSLFKGTPASGMN